VTLDIDSLPIEVDGHQPGAEYNGHYGATIFHPLIATAAELGDILDVKLRPGNAHTSEGGLDFILALVKAAREKLCQVAAVRVGRPPNEARDWTVEMTYKAAGWTNKRRGVLVISERPAEMFLHHF
jgi:hypothetical protein